MTTSPEPNTPAPANGNHDLPFAKELFEAADGLRGSVESSEYKHLVLGLLFLSYISDAFERRRTALEAETHDSSSDLFTESDEERLETLEDRDEYVAENVFWGTVPRFRDSLLTASIVLDKGSRIPITQRGNAKNDGKSASPSCVGRETAPA